MSQKPDLTRRQLLKTAITAAAAPMIVPSSALGLAGAALMGPIAALAAGGAAG